MKNLVLLFVSSLLLSACSETHQSIYHYDKLYHIKGIDSFKMGHFKDKVSDSIVYLNSDSNFNKENMEELCERNQVKCFIQDLNINSKSINTELEASLAGLKNFDGKQILVVSDNKDAAALFFSTYAFRTKKASDKSMAQISADLGADSKRLNRIMELAKGTPQTD